MDVTAELTNIAALIGEPARALMLWNLLDGEARSAGELALFANVSPQSASLHLAKLLDAGMISVQAKGRHRYYTISRPEVAYTIESMAALTPSTGRNYSLRRALNLDFRNLRSCYDHLAGRVAIEFVCVMQKQGWLMSGKTDFIVTAKGARWLRDFDIDIDGLRQQRRSFSRKCLDWSERQYHLAGSLGAALLQELLKRRWLARRPGRILSVTLEGREQFSSVFGLHL